MIVIVSEKDGSFDVGGVQILHRFDNGYGASIVKNEYSHGGSEGLWELAVIRWNGEKFSLVYHTSITDDVLGYLSDSEVQEVLERIEALEA